MARKKLPYYPMYPKDFDTDENVRSMNDTEIGFFVRCLNHSWNNGSIPENLDDLARVMHSPLGYVKKLWVKIGRCFVQAVEPGRLVNVRQEEERAEAAVKSWAASRSAAQRWHSDRNADQNANASPPHSDRNANQMENQNQNQKTTEGEWEVEATVPPKNPSPWPTSSETDLGGQDPYDEFCHEFKGPIPENTWQEFAAQVSTPERLTALRVNMPLWQQTMRYRDGFHDAVKFLRSGVWLRPPKPEIVGSKDQPRESGTDRLKRLMREP